MDYTHLTTEDLQALRRERIATLEAEHFRLALLLHETTDPDVASELIARQAEYQRRIELHLAAPVTKSEPSTTEVTTD